MQIHFPPAGPQFPRPCGAKFIGSCCYSLLKPCRRPNWPALKPGTPSHLGADEGRPNTAAAPLTREQASERVLGFGGWWVVSCCQSHRCHREMAARVEACCLLHSTQEATARVGNVRRLQRREQQQKTSIDCAVGLGGLHGLGIGWPTTCFAGDHLTASRRDMFDNERSDNIRQMPVPGAVAQMSRRLAHFADEQHVQDVPAQRLASCAGNAGL